jgi:hypothetical protein
MVPSQNVCWGLCTVDTLIQPSWVLLLIQSIHCYRRLARFGEDDLQSVLTDQPVESIGSLMHAVIRSRLRLS